MHVSVRGLLVQNRWSVKPVIAFHFPQLKRDINYIDVNDPPPVPKM